MARQLEEQTRIRLRLLEGGYTPLANLNKVCVLKGWPGLKVDEGVIDGWSDQLRYMATGVRVDRDMVVLDFDIDHEEMLDAIWEALPARLARLLDSAPLRFGGGVKFALFLRRATGDGALFGRMVSQGYEPPEGGGLMRVEVFDAGAPRQFGVYGPRSEDTVYSWAGGWGLADVPLAGLPTISVEDVRVVLDAASVAMRQAGWTYEVKTHEGSVDGRPRWDIPVDAVFQTEGHGEVVGVEALEALCDVGGSGVRLSASWLEGSGAVNTSRCIARLNAGDGRLQIWESAGCVLHRPVGLDVGSKVAALGDRLGRVTGGGGGRGEPGGASGSGRDEAGGAGLSRLDALMASVDPDKMMFSGGGGEGADGEDGAGAEVFDVALESLLRGWAWVAVGNGFAAPVGGTPDQMLTLGGLRNTMAPWCKMEKRNKREVEVNPADVWIKHGERVMVAGHRLLPWSTDKVVADDGDGQAWLNTYAPPAHAAGGLAAGAGAADGAADDVWLRFLAHLVPDARERGWFEMWLAAKVQRPWLPNCGVVMVAETHGTGRGTLFDVLGAVLGERHVSPVTSTELMGGGGQGQYTDWLADALMVTCDELLAGNDAGGSMEWKRRDVYERLKTLVDPRTRRVRIVRKGLPGYDTEVFASFLMATNNPNALPLAEQDRRFAILRNTDVKLVDAAGGLHADLSAFRDGRAKFDAGFGGAIWRRLAGLMVDWDAVRDAPEWMVGRGDMLAANESDLEDLVRGVLDDVPGDFILNEHLRARLRLAVEAAGMTGELKNWWVRAQDMLSKRNTAGWRRMARRQDVMPRGAGGGGGRKFATVYYRVAGVGEAAWAETSLEDRAALWKRGGDVNDRLSRLESKMRERGISVAE